MNRQRKIWVKNTLVFVLVLQCASAFDECKTGCAKDPGLLNLKPGTTYKYDYDGKFTMQLSSAENQQTTTEVKANILLTQQTGCSQVLRLQNVKVIGPDGKERNGIPDIEKPIVLNSNNGNLNDFICSEQGDTPNSLNLKRAIASFFQINPNKNSEIDVFGQCPTHVYKSQDGDTIIISKSKNLNKCSFRESNFHSFITGPFNSNNKIDSSPLLDSKLYSEQRIEAGVLVSATVKENYLFVPFSVRDNGAKATVESKIAFTGSESENPTTKCGIPKSIIFENTHLVSVQKPNMKIILEKVKEISENLQTNVEDTTAIQFVELVKLLKVSKKTDILSVYNQVKSGVGYADKDAAKKILLDAILTAGNGETIQVAIELLKNKELTPVEERQLYVGFTRARHVTEATIKTATYLLNRANLPLHGYLAVGSLAGKYCAQHSCENVEVINKVIQQFLGKLGDLQASNRKEENGMIFVLKGLANIGYLNDAILSKLVSLAEDDDQPIRLRVATLEAFASAPCNDKLRDSALKILKNIRQDSEIRIKAYLLLAKCPNDKIGNAIKTLLETEPTNQVGGYISSHIKNLRSSANPDKLLAKTHLGFIHTPNRFIVDPRKYSINAELSHSVDVLGLSNVVEGDIIYSHNSWLPRSVNLNLTTEILGQKFNFLEITARQENLENILEHYLGPRGILRKASLQQNWDNYVKPVQNVLKELREKVDKSLRDRRDVPNADIDAINKKIQTKSNELDGNFDLDLSIKNFGSEIIFMNSFDLIDELTPRKFIDNFVKNLNKGIDELNSFENTLRANLLILDAELSYPTSLGFPLRLGLDGASNIQIKTEGTIDARNFFPKSTAKDVNFKLSLIPSATVTIVGSFSLDTPLLENGLKIASTMHTSSGGVLIVDTFKEGSGLDVKFTVPIEKQELVGLKHDIIFQSKENGVINNQRLKFSQNKELSICADQLASFIGLEFCADITGPNLSGKNVPILPFPLSGDAKASLRIERGDIDTLHYRREFIPSKEATIGVEAILETYGKTTRGVSLNFQGYLSPEKYLKLKLNSPIKNGEAEVRLVSNNDKKLISFYLKDEIHLYTAKAGFTTSVSGDKVIYKPLLEYTTPKKKGPQVPPYHLEGKIIAENKGNDVKFSMHHLKLITPDKKDISVDGFMGTDGPGYITDVTFSDGSNTATVKGHLIAQAEQLKLEAQVKNTINPDMNINFIGEFKKKEGLSHISSNILLTHGKDLSSKTNTLNTVSIFSLKYPGKDVHLITKNKVSYPRLKINTKFDLERTSNSLDYDVLLNYGEIKVGSTLKAKINKTVGDHQLEFKANGFGNHVEIESSRQIIGVDESKIHNSISLNRKKLEVFGRVKHHVKLHNINLGTDLVIMLPNSKIPFKLNGGVKRTSKDLYHYLKLYSENSALIETLLKTNTLGDAKGRMKVDFKDLHIDGNIKAQKGIGNGDIQLDIKSMKKSAKFETSFNINYPTYNLDFTLYPAFNEDENKKMVFSTKNRFTSQTIDSSSTIDVLGSMLAVNAKIQMGSPINGKTLIDVDLTLPSQQYLAVKLVRNASNNNRYLNIDSSVSLEQRTNKATPGRKFEVKGVARNSNIQLGILDLDINASVDDSAGHNLNVDLRIKRQKNGDKWCININNNVKSSFLNNPIDISYSAENQALDGNFHLKSTASENAHVQLGGKYSFNEENSTFSGELKVDIGTPFQSLSSLKSGHSFKILNNQVGSSVSAELSGYLQTISSIQLLNFDANGNLKIEGNKEAGSIEYHTQLKQPVQISIDQSGNYNINWTQSTGTMKGDFKAVLEENKVIQGSSVLTRNDPQGYHLEATLDLPIENHKSIKIIVDTKHNENKDISSQVQLIHDGQKYRLNTDLSLDQRTPSISLKLVHPDGKNSELSSNLNRQGNYRLSADLKVLCECKNILLEGSLDVNSENIKKFYVQVTANSPNLNINKIFIKIGNASGNDGNNLNVMITTAGKNFVSGSASVTSRQDHGKFIIEGSANFKINDKDQTGHFKYIRSFLTTDKNGETGEEVTFDASLGNRAIDAEFKLTNNEFKYLNSYCEESKKCAHILINARTDVNDIARYSNQIQIDIDLRILDVPNVFGLKALTKRKGFVLDHTVDIHFGNALNKYQYSIFVHRKQAGIALSMPKRTIALEAEGELGHFSLQQGGKANFAISFFTDKKNNPNTKSVLKALIAFDKPKDHIELNLNAAGLAKPLTILYTRNIQQEGLTSQELILDIFVDPDKKIVISHEFTGTFSRESYKLQGESFLTAKSSGLGIDISVKRNALLDPKAFTASYQGTSSIGLKNVKLDSILKLTATPKDINVLLKLLNNDLLKVDSAITIQKGFLNVITHITGLGLKPVVSDLEIKNYHTVKLTQFLNDDPSSKLLISAALIPGQIADARAVLNSDGTKKELFHASILLDENNFLQPDFALNNNNIKEFSEKARQVSVEQLKQLTSNIKEGAQDVTNVLENIGDIIKESIPDTIKLQKFYQSEWDKIKEEIASDKYLQNLALILKNVLQAIGSTISKIITYASDIIAEISKSLKAVFSALTSTLQTKIIPKLKEIIDEVTASLRDLLDQSCEVIYATFAKFSKILEIVQPYLKTIATILSEVTNEIKRFIVKSYESLEAAVIEEIKRIKDEIKASPLIAKLKAPWESLIGKGLQAQEFLVNTMSASTAALKEITVIPEFQDTIDLVEEYLRKKITNKPVDDVTELIRIGKSFLRGLAILPKIIMAEIPDVLDQMRFSVINFELLKKFELGRGTIKISVLEYLLKEDIKPILKFLLRLIFVPKDHLIPRTLYGDLTTEIFTYDDNVFILPGNCSYLLTTDVVNGNFSVVAEYVDKKFTSFTVTDKDGSVTVKLGKILFNNVETDLPIHEGGLYVGYYTNLILIQSSAGLKATCNLEMVGCGVRVSGFYHGQLRGLFGNANHEKYDDFMLPNGEIASSVSEFVSAYALGSQCPPVAAEEAKNSKPDPGCDKLFSWESPLSSCYPFIDRHMIKRGCELAVAAGHKHAYYQYSLFYAYRCWKQNIPAYPSPEFSDKCKNSMDPHTVDEKFQVKLPGKLADILLVINIDKPNEIYYKEYIQPLVTKLTDDFSSKGITDVEFQLITYGGEHEKATFVTVNGKPTFKGQAPNLKFSERPNQTTLVTGIPDLDSTLGQIIPKLDELKVTLGLHLPVETLLEAVTFPFRAEAVKHIIYVINEPCPHTAILPVLFARVPFHIKKELSISLLSPLELKTKDPKIAKGIISINAEGVKSLSNTLESSELLGDLDYDNICADHVIGVGGNVYVGENLLANKNNKAKILDIMAKNVISQTLGKEIYLECTCSYTYINPFTPYNRCTHVHVAEKET